jgi:hypothetical protein
MKKLILIFQILILVSQNIYADDTRSVQVNVAEPALASPLTMPKNYKLPDMHLLDSVRFYNQYKDQQGKRLVVDGFTGRFGATYGEDFKKKIFEIESRSGEHVEIILTLTSTMEDAKIYQKRLALVGRKTVIVEIPDEVQQEILEKATAQAAGGFKELWWDTKHKVNKLMSPIDSASYSMKIIKNQFVKPNRYDLNIVGISVATTIATTGALVLFVPGVDPAVAVSMCLTRILIGAPLLAVRRTVGNLYKAKFFEDTAQVSVWKQVLLRVSTLGLGVGELYYGIGTEIGAQGLSQAQVFTNATTSGVIDNLASIQRDRRLSEIANYRMFVYSLIISSAISTVGIAGYTGGMALDYSLLQLNYLQSFSLVIFGSLWLSYKFFSNNVERIAQKDLKLFLYERFRKLTRLRQLREEREQREYDEALSKRKQLAQVIQETQNFHHQKRSRAYPMCSSLFN